MPSTKLGQMLLVGIPGKKLSAETAARLKKVQPGGFIIFTRNLSDASGLRELLDQLREISEIEPILTIDQEGGRVSRLRYIGNEPPSATQLWHKGDRKLITEHGELTGEILRLFGFNLNLCPVLDISVAGDTNNSLKLRTWGDTPDLVIHNAGIFNQQMRTAGVLSCGKHFPGYGYAAIDPHDDLPTIRRERGQIFAEELVPFAKMAGELDSMMIGHSCYPALALKNPTLPASLSSEIINDLLRDELGFQGLVMTDDLDMGAILNRHDFAQMFELAVAAGNDMCMLCHRVELFENALAELEKQPRRLLDAALARIATTKAKLSPPTDFSLAKFQQLDNKIWDLRVATLGEKLAAQQSEENAKRSPVELY